MTRPRGPAIGTPAATLALAAIRADVDKANSPSPVSNRYGAELRTVEHHAPAMLRALEAVLEMHFRVQDGIAGQGSRPNWSPTYGCEHCSTEDVRIPWPCPTVTAIETALEPR